MMNLLRQINYLTFRLFDFIILSIHGKSGENGIDEENKLGRAKPHQKRADDNIKKGNIRECIFPKMQSNKHKIILCEIDHQRTHD